MKLLYGYNFPLSTYPGKTLRHLVYGAYNFTFVKDNTASVVLPLGLVLDLEEGLIGRALPAGVHGPGEVELLLVKQEPLIGYAVHPVLDQRGDIHLNPSLSAGGKGTFDPRIKASSKGGPGDRCEGGRGEAVPDLQGGRSDLQGGRSGRCEAGRCDGGRPEGGRSSEGGCRIPHLLGQRCCIAVF